VDSIDPTAIARHVLAEYRLELSGIHGPAHWLRVRQNGLALARRTPAADPVVIEAFALLHDARRHDDDIDPGHGERAAAFARELADRGVLTLKDEQLAVLIDACNWHTHPMVSDHPTIGCCWDADRLDLSRLDARPKDHYLSTAAARDPRVQRDAWTRGFSWSVDVRGAARWGLAVEEITP
jgi:uncharacterized protein